MKLISLTICVFFGVIATINAYPSVKGVPSQVSDVKGFKVPPSPGHYDRPSKVGQAKDDVKGLKTVPVVQQHQQQVHDEVKGVQQRDQVKGQVPVVSQHPVKGADHPVKGIQQHPIKGQHPVVRRPHPVKGYPQQKDDEVKGGKSLVQHPQEVKGVHRQRPQYPVKGFPQQTPQQVQDDYQQRQQPVFPVKGQRKTRSLVLEQDADQSKVGQPAKGRKGGFKSVPKSPTKSIPRIKGKSVEDVKVIQQEAKVADVQVKSDEQVKVIQESVPVIQEKTVQESVPVQEKVVSDSKVVQEKTVQESVPVQEKVVSDGKVVQEVTKVADVQVKSEQVKDVQVKSEEAVKGQSIDHVVVAVANGVGSGASSASATASASAVVVVTREEPQVKEDTKTVKDEGKQGRNLSKVGSPVKGVPFHRKKITQQKEIPVQQHEQVVQDQTVQSN